jgi:hypothetical protein
MNVVKALPPLVVEESDLERFSTALDQVIERFESMGRSMARLTLGMAWRSLRGKPATGSAPPAETA